MGWTTGETIILREIHRGRIWTARPATVAAVTGDLLAAYLAPGTHFRVPAGTDHSQVVRRLRDGWTLADYTWTMARSLHLLMPDIGYSVHLWWLPPDWRFGGWYINLQEPIRSTCLGYDSMDQLLDIVIDPDLTWRWKDEDELAEAVELGLMTEAKATAVRREGERAIERLEARRSPFCDGWETWRPDAAWPVPTLPDEWDHL